MKLKDFMNMAYAKEYEQNVRFTVFGDRDAFDAYMDGDKAAKKFTVDSAYFASSFLLEKYANAQVEHFCATGEDDVSVIVRVEDAG